MIDILIESLMISGAVVVAMSMMIFLAGKLVRWIEGKLRK